jgi:ABC-type sulfate transport system permease subunit
MLALPSISLFVAIYRAYKVRFELNSVLLTVSFFLVLVAGAPIGEAIWGGFSPIRKWIIEVPAASAERGLIITMALGVIGLSLRTIFGIERTWLGILRMPALERREGEQSE